MRMWLPTEMYLNSSVASDEPMPSTTDAACTPSSSANVWLVTYWAKCFAFRRNGSVSASSALEGNCVTRSLASNRTDAMAFRPTQSLIEYLAV